MFKAECLFLGVEKFNAKADPSRSYYKASFLFDVSVFGLFITEQEYTRLSLVDPKSSGVLSFDIGSDNKKSGVVRYKQFVESRKSGK